MAKSLMPNVHCYTFTKRSWGLRRMILLTMIKTIEALFIWSLKNYYPCVAVLYNKKGRLKLKKTLLSVKNLDTYRRFFEIYGIWKMSLRRKWGEGGEREAYIPTCEKGRPVPLPMRSWSWPLCSEQMLKLLRSDVAVGTSSWHHMRGNSVHPI